MAVQNMKELLKLLKSYLRRSTVEDLVSLDEELFLQIFDGVPQKEIAKSEVIGSNIVDLISDKSDSLNLKVKPKENLLEMLFL